MREMGSRIVQWWVAVVPGVLLGLYGLYQVVASSDSSGFAWALAGVSLLLLAALKLAYEALRERDEAVDAARGGETLADWLAERIREVRVLQTELKGLYPPSVQAHARIRSVEASLASLNERVLSKLRLTAPGYVDEFAKNPDWVASHLLLGDEERQEVDRLLDYTAGQLNSIREDQR